VRVVLIDADDRVRESLCGLLCIGDRLEVVGSTGELGRAVDLVLATRPDIVLMDPRLTDVDDGASLIGRIRTAAPGVHILVLTAAEPAGDVASQPAVAAADGFVRKTFRPSDLVAAVLAAAG
jgi:DNA-binding NarL/FixJ family response regulator